MNLELPSSDESLNIPVEGSIELRLLGAGNEDEVYEAVMQNRDHLKPWVFWAGDGFSRDTVRDMLAKNEEGFRAGTAYAMGIYDDGKLIGSTDIRDIGSEKGAEVGYWVAKDATGMGLASKAAAALIGHARMHHHIPKIVLHTMLENEASSRVAEKLGFSFDRVVDNGEQGIQEKRYVRVYE